MNYLVLAISNDGQEFVGTFTDYNIAINICDNCRKSDGFEYFDVNVYEYKANTKFDIFKAKVLY